MSEATLRGWIRDDAVGRHYGYFLNSFALIGTDMQSHKFNTECAETTRALDAANICVYVQMLTHILPIEENHPLSTAEVCREVALY
jgi:hypothetical protein